MTAKSKSGKWAGAGLLSAVAASLCCIAPVLALISGASGVASTFSWMEPFRPYLIGITVFVLAFAWYQKLKPKTKEEIDCNCDDDGKLPFMQTKKFLGMITVFAALMLAFPYYSRIFYPDNKKEVIIMDSSNVQNISFTIKGMTCSSCEEHVNHAVNELDGIISVESSYNNGNSKIAYDPNRISEEAIKAAIATTGYKIVE